MKRLVPLRNFIFRNSLILMMMLATHLVAAQTPTITSITPTVVTKNTRITISGSDFGTNATVTIGGAANGTNTFSYVSRSNTTIVLSVSNATTAVAISGAVVITRTQSPGVGNNTTSTESISYVTPVVKHTGSGVRVTEIFTDYNGFWNSTSATTHPTANQPNTRHNLLGFRYGGVVYSTGVNDQALTDNSISFTPQAYRAYSTRGVEGTTNGNLFLAMADLIDGTAHNALGAPSSPEIAGLTVFDVLIDGENGLDLGTGVTNFNTSASISFFSDNAQSNSGTNISDNIPEVLITQIAEPGNTDYYHFSDVNGNIVGHPVQMAMNSIAAVGRYRLDLFTFTPGNLATATPLGNRGVDHRYRDIRIVGLRFADFGIDDTNIDQINSFDMLAGGTADVAFLAYNTASFQIASPVITSAPNSVRICSLPYNHDVTFSVGAAIQGGGPGTLNYQWKKNNSDILATDPAFTGANTNTLTVHGPINTAELATYKVEISNEYGAIVASSAVLRQGGTPVVWNGTSWNTTPTALNSLVFNGDYDSATNLPSGTKLEGCDCKVQNGANVIIDSGDTLILQNAIEVAPFVPGYFTPELDGDGNPTGNNIWVPDSPAGTFTLRDDASLIQVNELAANSGVISKKRVATNLHQWDYVYWSSPVSGFNVSGLSAYTTPMYQWNPTTTNPNGTYGMWTNASGNMTAGKGYIARVSSAADVEVTFDGAPHNGVYNIALTGSTNPNPDINYWNLVGNPYPSAIKALDFINSNTDIEGNVRLWTHGSPIGTNNSEDSPYYNNFTHNYADEYVTYNAMGSTPAGFNGIIASGQGFFVQGKSTTGSITFQNTFRYKETQALYDNSQFYRLANPVSDAVADEITDAPTVDDSEKSIIWLSLVNATSKSANTAIGYTSEATMGKDRLYDASTEPGNFSIYSLVGTDPVIIQGRPTFIDTDEVPVGFSVPSAGIYKIAIDRVAGVFANTDQDIFLKDTELGIEHDLRATPYEFTAMTSGNIANRFVLQYRTAALGMNDLESNQALAFIANQTLNVKANDGIKTIEVFDITGKLVNRFDTENATEFTAPFHFPNGFYMGRVTLTSGVSVTQKMIAN